MKHKKKEKAILNSLQSFIQALQEYAEEVEHEGEFDEYLKDELVSILMADDQLFGASVFSKLKIGVWLHRPETEIRSQSIKSAMMEMNDEAICWFLDHIYCSKKVTNRLENILKGYSVDPEDLKSSLNSLRVDTHQLQEWLNHDLYERIQVYRNEIKKLQEEN